MEHVLGLLRLDKLQWMDVLDIALVAVLIYFALDAVRGTRASQMLLGIVLLFVTYELTQAIGLRTVHKVLEYAFRYIPFIVIVIFQSEIRRALTALGKNPPRITLRIRIFSLGCTDKNRAFEVARQEIESAGRG